MLAKREREFKEFNTPGTHMPLILARLSNFQRLARICPVCANRSRNVSLHSPHGTCHLSAIYRGVWIKPALREFHYSAHKIPRLPRRRRNIRTDVWFLAARNDDTGCSRGPLCARTHFPRLPPLRQNERPNIWPHEKTTPGCHSGKTHRNHRPRNIDECPAHAISRVIPKLHPSIHPRQEIV